MEATVTGAGAGVVGGGLGWEEGGHTDPPTKFFPLTLCSEANAVMGST